MKKIHILIVLGLLILLFGTVQPAQAALTAHWAPSVSTVSSTGGGKPDSDPFMQAVAQLDAAASKFEGFLNAFSVNQKQNMEEQLLASEDDLSASLNEFNAVLSEVYPDLTEEEQLAVEEAYSLLGLYLEDLAARTNLVVGREVFQIEYNYKIFDIIDAISIGPGKP
ncbi:MAG: hypothetical protein HY669_02430 [Chloroflexi bacterium]|nr:hypothetical protein [Chloroflexota bacterium]